MADLSYFPAEAFAVPAADLRMMADLLASMQQACGRAMAMLLERLDDYDGDPDLEDATDLEIWINVIGAAQPGAKIEVF